ncbi:M14 family metallopeptidase [Pseudidiomarina marina]|uniref:Peptidase n=1 Tax=Pseudidiomarina marina TaxID=502366 RepID=A0A432YFZ5_9GAMM|nr:M14 family metallocarboxypeptidase [Pseudidiomarina marina]RUO59872.1 peptidase [Pseudidiomarina marina]
MTEQQYPIGTPGQPWGVEEKQHWLKQQSVKRSYFDDVVTQINRLHDQFDVEQYGALEYPNNTFPLFLLKTRNWDAAKPNVLVTGGVHGYETSGVHGALAFAKQHAEHYSQWFNILIAPCISPWGYETINRWNPFAIDPNRSFKENSPAGECAAIMDYIASHQLEFVMHIDLHETTDTDNSEFRPALAARDGKVNTNWNIPDGFYTVGNSEKPTADFQKAIIDSVRQVTHIAPADDEGKIIGAPVEQEGVIHYAGKELGLCMGLTDAPYVSTTEVYPDSANASPEECIEAQVAAVKGALEYMRQL